MRIVTILLLVLLLLLECVSFFLLLFSDATLEEDRILFVLTEYNKRKRKCSLRQEEVHVERPMEEEHTIQGKPVDAYK